MRTVSSARTVAGARTTAGVRQLSRNFGTCLRGDGVTAKISLTLTSGLPLYSGNTTYTVAAWVKPRLTVAGVVNTIFCEGVTTATSPTFLLDVIASGTLRVLIRNNAGGALVNSVPSVTVLRNDVWYHVVITDNNGDVRLYINGTEDANSVANAFDYTRSGVFTFTKSTIGCLSRDVDQNFLPGKLDEILMFGRALTATEVSNLYKTAKFTSTNLIAYYKFDEGSGTTATDSSGNGNTGTIAGCTYSTDVFTIPREVA